MTFPRSILLDFFQQVIDSLNKVPNLPMGDKTVSTNTRIPIQKHRETLLQLQLEILSSVVEDYNNEHDNKISLEEAQVELKDMGSSLSEEEETSPDKHLTNLMEEMNEAARTALVRLILKSEWDFCKNEESDETPPLLGQTEGDSLNYSDIKSFCALCIKAVSLPGVIHYLEYGGDLTFQTHVDIESESNQGKKDPIQIQQRMMNLQNMLYRGVGYDPDFAIAEITSILTKNPVTPEEIDSFETVTECVSIMRQAFENITLASEELLSDETEGGCTRVISVKFSEHEVDPTAVYSQSGTTTVSGQQRMEEHVEESQRRDLELARQAASLQQGILGELLSMGEEERCEILEKAKVTHDSFMVQAMEIPMGTERIQFLQTLTGEKQRLLVMHKLWEKLLADHGGEPPQIRNE